MEPSCAAISADVARAVEVLRTGGLVAFPTETVYGLGADAANAQAVSRIFAVKGRPADHPLIVHIRRAQDMPLWASEVPDAAWVLGERFWPGPLTLVLRRHRAVLDLVTGGLETVALRVPSHRLAQALLERFGGGIAAPSANRFGRVSPTEAAHVAEELGGLVDLILDGGRCEVGIESTIVDLTSPEPAILRPGGIPKDMLEEVLRTSVSVRRGGPVRSPGQHPVHYAPHARVIVVSSEGELRAQVAELLAAGARVAVMSPEPWAPRAGGVLHIPLPSSLPGMARELYRSLRLADQLGADAVVAMSPPASGLGSAIADRLERAAGAGRTDAQPSHAGKASSA